MYVCTVRTHISDVLYSVPPYVLYSTYILTYGDTSFYAVTRKSIDLIFDGFSLRRVKFLRRSSSSLSDLAGLSCASPTRGTYHASLARFVLAVEGMVVADGHVAMISALTCFLK